MMKKFNKVLYCGLIFLLSWSIAACSRSIPTSPTTAPASLTISAAASLKEALDEVKTNYSAEKPGVALTINYGSSGALQQQIEQGAEVDLFMSAASKQMDQLKAKDLILDDSRINLLENKLVLIVPKDSRIELKDFQDVVNQDIKRLALGEPKSVPAGQYAAEVFTKLGILDSITSKSVYGKDVKSVLAWVESGDADAGVVYATDAKTSSQVKVIATAADGTHSPIVYPVGITKSSKNVDAAKDFLSYLSSDKAKVVFEKYGFTFTNR